MIRFLSIAILALGACVPAAWAQEEAEVVQFKSRQPTVGEFQGARIKNSSSTTANMSRDGEEMPERSFSSSSTTSRDVTILEAKDGQVTRVKLHWREILRENDMDEMRAAGRRRRPGAEDETPAAEITELTGKTFILDLSGATPTVKDEEGNDAGEAITKLVTRLESSEGKFTGWSPDILAALGKTEFKVGEVIPLTKETAQKVLARQSRPASARRGGRGRNRGGEEGEEPEDNSNYQASLTFKGKSTILGNECGRFEISITESRERAGEQVQGGSKTTLTGEIILGIETGWLYKLEVKGKTSSDVSISTERGSMESTTEGKMETSHQVIYAKAKPAAQ